MFFSDCFNWLSEGKTQFYSITIDFLENNPLLKLVELYIPPSLSYP